MRKLMMIIALGVMLSLGACEKNNEQYINKNYRDSCYSYTLTSNMLMPVGSCIYESQTENVFVLLDSNDVVIDGDVYKVEIGKWSHRSGPIYCSKTLE